MKTTATVRRSPRYPIAWAVLAALLLGGPVSAQQALYQPYNLKISAGVFPKGGGAPQKDIAGNPKFAEGEAFIVRVAGSEHLAANPPDMTLITEITCEGVKVVQKRQPVGKYPRGSVTKTVDLGPFSVTHKFKSNTRICTLMVRAEAQSDTWKDTEPQNNFKGFRLVITEAPVRQRGTTGIDQSKLPPLGQATTQESRTLDPKIVQPGPIDPKRIPDLKRPDLKVQRLTTYNGSHVWVTNSGSAPSGETKVKLVCSMYGKPCFLADSDLKVERTFNDRAQETKYSVKVSEGAYFSSQVVKIPPIAPGKTAQVRIYAKTFGHLYTRCFVNGFQDWWKKGGASKGCTVTATVDPDKQVDESNEANNTVVWQNYLIDSEPWTFDCDKRTGACQLR